MDEKIVILGAGESGIGASILAKKHNYEVFVSDKGKIIDAYKNELIKHNIDFEENTHSFDKILDADIVIKSPGIPNNIEVIQKIKDSNIPVISEIEFAAKFTKAKMICITGSNGKTTTTLLTYEIFKNAGYNVGLGGNVGQSFAKQVAESDYDFYVLELSSFQLDDMREFKADTAVLLNITPDHMDRYDNKFINYVNSKLRITQNQTSEDNFIYNIDDEAITENISSDLKSKKLPFSIKVELNEGASLKEKTMVIKNENNSFEMLTSELNLTGKHNIYNSMAAAIAAMSNDIKNPVIRETLASFKGVEHRLEKFQTIRGVHFINDSKATNVNSVWYALEAVETPIVLIMGGQDKGNDYSVLKQLVRQKVKAIVAMGLNNEKIIENFGNIVPVVESNEVNDAVLKAYKLAEENETVLLSPACASFDLFDNYIDRGKKFKEAVRNL